MTGIVLTVSNAVKRRVVTRKAMPPTMPDGAVQPRSLAALNRMIAETIPSVPGGAEPVFGEGPADAAIVMVGEQPGDQEDRIGRPFVGPAGRMLSQAMAEAGIAREEIYLTNAVKHFKFEERGKRRIHQRPTAGEVKHYRWWLMQELELIQPRIVVALGATAVLALAGRAIPVSRARGEARFGKWPGYITVHPSYLLRLTDDDAKEAAYRSLVADLRRIKAAAEDMPMKRRVAS